VVQVRQHHGRDIGGACGQLALSRDGPAPARDIEDLMGRPAGAAGEPRARQRRVRRSRGSEGEEAVVSEGAPGDVGLPSAVHPLASCARFTWIVSASGLAVGGLLVLLFKLVVVKYMIA
jgi:hypothetical protein